VSNCVVWPAAKMPCVGAKLYLSAGIAFAAPTTWNSIMESKPSTAFAGSSFVPTGGDGGGPTHLRPHLHTTTHHHSNCKNQSTNTHCLSSIQVRLKSDPAYQTFLAAVRKP
jgi:hypothetical protein